MMKQQFGDSEKMSTCPAYKTSGPWLTAKEPGVLTCVSPAPLSFL